MARVKEKKLFVDAVAEIIDPVSGQVVGLVYRWNNGETRKRWTGRKIRNYRLRPLEDNTKAEVEQ
ncbi:hypothetical protein ACFOMH_18890 [Paracoccus mangrovi]|uniref:Uncharacterized protein n=1 Tax=Paracoccus mangrovi TaxID=1715645 RepID=A0ABV7RAE8_9RHOB